MPPVIAFIALFPVFSSSLLLPAPHRRASFSTPFLSTLFLPCATFNFHGPLPTSSFFMGGIFPIPTLPFSRLSSPHAPLSALMALFQLECPSSKFFLPGPGSERSRACLFLPIFPSFVLLLSLRPFLPTFYPGLALSTGMARFQLQCPSSKFSLPGLGSERSRPCPFRPISPSFVLLHFLGPFLPTFYTGLPLSTIMAHFQLSSPLSKFFLPGPGSERSRPCLFRPICPISPLLLDPPFLPSFYTGLALSTSIALFQLDCPND